MSSSTALLMALLCGVARGAPVTRASVVCRHARGSGEFVWHDLVTDNPAACRAFYGALFGWTFEAGDGIDPGYTIIKHDGVPIGGIVPPAPERRIRPFIAQWLAYVVVPDVDACGGGFAQQGGHVIRGPLNVRKDLRVAVVADPQGAPLGLASGGPRFDTGDASRAASVAVDGVRGARRGRRADVLRQGPRLSP